MQKVTLLLLNIISKNMKGKIKTNFSQHDSFNLTPAPNTDGAMKSTALSVLQI